MAASLLDKTTEDGSPAYYRSMAAYGEACGVSRACVSKWNKKNWIVFVEDPSTGRKVVDAIASDAARQAAQNPLKREAPPAAGTDAKSNEDLFAGGGEGDGDATPGRAATPSPTSDDPLKRSAAEAVSREKWLGVREKELKLRKHMGELCRVDDAREAVFVALRKVRDTMQRVAGDVAERANPSDPARANREVAAEIDKKLASLAIELETLLTSFAGAGATDVPDIEIGSEDSAAGERTNA